MSLTPKQRYVYDLVKAAGRAVQKAATKADALVLCSEEEKLQHVTQLRAHLSAATAFLEDAVKVLVGDKRPPQEGGENDVGQDGNTTA